MIRAWKRKAWTFVLAAVSLSHVAAAAAAAAGVAGRIVDAASSDPVAQAEVTVSPGGQTVRTDRDGRFVFDRLAPGAYTLRATRLGYQDLAGTPFLVPSEGDVSLELTMTARAGRLEEVVVTPGTFSFMESGTAARQTMSREDIEQVPQLGEDVFRAVNRLPGLSSGDYSAHFSIRGGRHDETLILLDGLELYEPYHLKDFNEGAISIIDTETVEGVQLMTGGFSARYGNKRSGVFDITSRKPERDRTRASAGISFLNARAMARGPWGSRASWMVSARSGYMDLVFKLINQADLPSPRYEDVFAKLQVDLSPSQVLTFDALYAGDSYRFDAASTTGFLDSLKTRENAHNRYGNSYVWSTLESRLGERTTVRTMLSAGLVTRRRDGSEKYVSHPEPIYTLTNRRDVTILGVKQDWTRELTDAIALSWGVDARRFRNEDTFHDVVGQDPNDPSQDPDGVYPFTVDTALEKSGSRVGLYVSNRLRVAAPLVVEVGGRYDRASWTGDEDLTPRTGAALELGGGRTLRLGWGRYRQIQGIDDVAALNAGSRYYGSELSEQWTAGLEQRFAGGALLRIEGYLKDGSDLRPVYRNWKNAPDTFPETNEDRILVFPKSNRARGLEIYYDRDLSARTAVRASYSYSIAEETVSRIENVNSEDPLVYDLTHPLPQDQRHAANADFTYRFRRPWSLNGSLAFHSGWPGTLEALVPVTGENGEPDTAVYPVKIYGSRLPAYFRFDVRATRRWTAGKGDMRLFVELVNLTNHANVFGYDYYRALDPSGNIVLERDDEQWFTILPSIGFSWTGSF